MPTSKKPRKAYKPKGVLLNPLSWVIEGFENLSLNSLHRIKIMNADALASIVAGKGSLRDAANVSTALDVAAVLCEAGIGAEYLPDIAKGMEAQIKFRKRWKTWDKLAYEGSELSAVRLALEVHDAQLDIATVNEVDEARKEVIRRIKSGHTMKLE